jgi:hypothetical protein
MQEYELISAQIGVRFRGQTGKHLLTWRLTGFDPKLLSQALWFWVLSFCYGRLSAAGRGSSFGRPA